MPTLADNLKALRKKRGLNLKTLRKKRGLTQVQLSERTDPKVSQSRISELEAGVAGDPSLATLRSLAKALGVKAGKLVGD